MRRCDQETAEQPVRAQHQHRRHHQEDQHQRALRQQRHAEGLQHADQQAGQEGARQAAQPTHHHDHEGFGDHRQVDLEVGRGIGQGQRAAQPGQPGAQGEDRGEEQALVHAQRRRHFPVQRRGAQQRAPARPVQQQPEQAQHHRPGRDEQQVVEGKAAAGDLHEAAHPARAGQGKLRRAPEAQREVLQDQHHAEGGQQLEQFRRPVHAAHHRQFQHRADQPRGERGEQHAQHEPFRIARQARQDAPADIGAEHGQAAMREVHDPRDAEEDRQARSHQEERGGPGQPRQQGGQEGFGHGPDASRSGIRGTANGFPRCSGRSWKVPMPVSIADGLPIVAGLAPQIRAECAAAPVPVAPSRPRHGFPVSGPGPPGCSAMLPPALTGWKEGGNLAP
ncbi:hypothetical protein ROTAS13_04241 [Roseomonas sp. TAS13]|nr:hypothetical protein ROTAS13_04241 [Roseomonas sp. TAS13]